MRRVSKPRLGPGGHCRRDLQLAISALLAAKTHLGRARTALRGADDLVVLKILRELRGVRERLYGVQARVGKPARQLELRDRAA